jgi:hypothetical protein
VNSTTATAALRERGGFASLVALAPAALLIGLLLPASGPGLALRLAGATACVLLVPGALVLRALGWTAAPPVAAAGALAVSLVIAGFGLGVVFFFDTRIVALGLVVALVCTAALPFAIRQERSSPGIRVDERWPFLAVIALSVAYSCVLWWAAGPLKSDGLFHAARERKLADFGSLASLSTVDEFKDGGVHPGYLFPLWHAVEALISRMAGVDVVTASIYLPAVLLPLAFVLFYAVGSVVFRSPWGGAALVVAALAQFGFARAETNPAGTGYFENLSWPRGAALLLIGVALLAVAFDYIFEGGWRYLVPLVSASFALTAIHLTNAPFIALVLGGFLLARLLVVRAWEGMATRVVVALGGVIVPFALFLPIVVPEARNSADVTPRAVTRAFELRHFHGIFESVGRWVVMSPDAIAHGGPMVAAGLLAIPLAAFAGRRVWAAVVLGGVVTILAVALTPPLFTFLSEFLSLSQTRRLPLFLPLGVAVVGAAAVLSRYKALGLAVAALAGIVLTVLYGARTLRFEGPGWVAIAGLVGGLVALVVAAVRQSQGPDVGPWALAIVAALVLPVGVRALYGLDPGTPTVQLTPGAIEAVREDVPAGDVVFSDPETEFDLAAYAPVYITSSRPGYVAPTKANRVRARIRDATRFLSKMSMSDAQRSRILRRWGAQWVLVDKSQPYPRDFLSRFGLVYQDGRYALYRLASETAGA